MPGEKRKRRHADLNELKEPLARSDGVKVKKKRRKEDGDKNEKRRRRDGINVHGRDEQGKKSLKERSKKRLKYSPDKVDVQSDEVPQELPMSAPEGDETKSGPNEERRAIEAGKDGLKEPDVEERKKKKKGRKSVHSNQRNSQTEVPSERRKANEQDKPEVACAPSSKPADEIFSSNVRKTRPGEEERDASGDASERKQKPDAKNKKKKNKRGSTRKAQSHKKSEAERDRAANGLAKPSKPAETQSDGNAQSEEIAVSPSGGPKSAERNPSKGLSNEDKDGGEAAEDDAQLDDKRLPRTLFVGNVPHSVTRKQIQKLFSQYAPIESVRIRNIVAANPKIPKKAALLANRLAKFSDSFAAYVVFKEATNIEDVLQRAVDGTNMTIFQEHHLRVTRAIQKKGKRRQSVFVGNLPFDCTDEELIGAFMPVAEECGVKLMNVRVNRDSDTGVGRGVGFVTFDDILGIQACLNKAGEITIRGRVIRIERAFKTKNMRSKSYKRKRKMVFGKNES